jgi:hypothetical protein
MKSPLASFSTVFSIVLLLLRLACRCCIICSVSAAAVESIVDWNTRDKSILRSFAVGSNFVQHFPSGNNDCHCRSKIDDDVHRTGDSNSNNNNNNNYAAVANESESESESESDAFMIYLNMTSGAATLTMNDEPWFQLVGDMQHVVGWNDDCPLRLKSTLIVKDHVVEEYQRFGTYTNVTFIWASTNDKCDNEDNDQVPATAMAFDQTTGMYNLHTSFLIFEQRQMIIFEQYFPNGWTNPGQKNQGGVRKKVRPGSSVWIMPKIVTGFPIINLTLPKEDLSYMSWGGCMLSHPHWGDWKDVAPDEYVHLFDADSNGQPWIVHDSMGRTVVWSNLDDFFVSGFAARPAQPLLDIGLRTTLESIPPGHKHSSILVAGNGINATIMHWGDTMLMNGDVQKERTMVYDDFTLAMLGYWTDNGAYHYTGATGPDYSNMEQALLGVKEGMIKKGVPIRYIQWDDWWMETMGDIPGMLSWTPKKEVFPSGFSDWLDMPLAMYAPEYASNNVWIDDYTWKVDTNTAIPIDPGFYSNLFANGTSIGMKSFEQDFLCSYGIGGTSLTNKDVTSGETWLRLMDEAAQTAGIKIQLCMADGYHILQSTMLPAVTNARGTGDNTRDYPSVLSMGQNTLLYYALGIYTSRDNAWTSRSDVNQKACGNAKFCYEPNAHLDNMVAVLAGGPYGIGDGLEFVNETVALYSCRSDGLLLRPQWPLTSLEFTFTDANDKGSLVWASHDEYRSLRWSYVVGVNLKKEIALTPTRLAHACSCSCRRLVAWEVVVGQRVQKVIEFSETSPFMLPPSKPLDLPYEVNSPPHTHYNIAPVLPSGMVFLGETAKWATMSFGRVRAVEVEGDTAAFVIAGAPSEVATFAYLMDVKLPDNIEEVHCLFAKSCPFLDKHGNAYCQIRLECSKRNGCTCVGMEEEKMLLEARFD